ncbi:MULTISPECIES: hypothetical protein [unclassified Bilifractor]|uniref:hypothetical protein n=1 Tax=unclassified Bilifractor TaxID=2815795 RepID=UPI003F93455A
MSKTKSWNDNWVYKIQPWGLTDPSTVITGETITLPHTWYKDDDYYRGEGVYQKIFPYTPAKERVFVKFHGVDKICKVFINGAQCSCTVRKQATENKR